MSLFDERVLVATLEAIISEEYRATGTKAEAHAVASRTNAVGPAETRLIDRLRGLAAKLKLNSGVVGFGIGEKLSGSQKTDDLAIRFYVRSKEPKSKLDTHVPEKIEFPNLGMVPTDVVEVGVLRAQLDTNRYRPARIGVSIAHAAGTAGTLGCYVRRKPFDGKIFILSNLHVLTSDMQGRRGDPILQPGPLDGGQAADVIARLSDTGKFDFSGLNEMDAALAEVIQPSDADCNLRVLDRVPASRIVRTPRRNQTVMKVGRSSDYSVAEILDVNATLDIEYPTTDGLRSATFRNQILCTRYTDAGDSGSLVMTKTGRPVGLHFAGSESKSVANRIATVFDGFRVEIHR
jgi:hypothetical protein